jgi:hypothetical protein
MLFRMIVIAIVSYLVMSLYRRFTRPSKSRTSGSSPFSGFTKRRKYGGKAVDVDFEELDDDTSDH